MMTRDFPNSLSDDEARQELYSLLHRPLTPKQVMNRVLEIGVRYLDIEHGHVTDIDSEENRWEVIGSTDPPDGPYPEGLDSDLSAAYCRRTFQQSSPLALHDAKNQGWADDPAYELHQLETYLGMRVDLFDEPYGTICFVTNEAREEAFSELELVFIELAGQVIQRALEQTQHERNLANRDRLISVLNRVLRHNLRNELNVIQGYAEMLQSTLSGDQSKWAETIVTNTTNLLAIAEKGRELENIARKTPIGRPTDIVPLVEEVVADIRSQHPEADVSLDAPDRAVTFASPQLSLAVTELLDNAVKYGQDEPTVEVAVNRKSDETEVIISDNGSGLPANERRILAGEVETPLEHGSGLGLVLVYWIITSLDGNIEVPETSSGTTVEIQLQNPSSSSSATQFAN